MKLIIKTKNDVNYNLEIGEDIDNIKKLKIKISKHFGIELTKMKLIYNGIQLEDDKTLFDYKIIDNSKIILIRINNEEVKKDILPPVSPQNLEEEKDKYLSKIYNLINLGYEKEKSEKALNEAKGNVDEAINILIKEKDNKNKNEDKSIKVLEKKDKQKEVKEKNKFSNELKYYAIYMKILTLNNENLMINILEKLKKNNPILLKQIKENEEAFLEILSSPITNEDIKIYNNNYSTARNLLDVDEIKKGKVQIFLTDNENKEINELKKIGYKEEDVIAAYIINNQEFEMTKKSLDGQKKDDIQKKSQK